MPDAEPTRYFFVHMQKTAGTALFKRLGHHFRREEIYPIAEDQRTVAAAIDVDLLQRRFTEHRTSLRLITGHFPLCVADVLGVPFATFTLLRDPVERTLSFLRHNRKLDPKSRDKTLEELYEDPVLYHGLINNHMVKMLSMTADEMTRWTMTVVEFDDERLARAKRNLAERIDVFGFQERFDQFCSDLEARFGFDLGPHVIANRTDPVPVSAELRRRIAEDNRMDVELYEHAAEMWRRAG